MVLEIIFDFSQGLMSSAGYAGLFVLMALESMIAPVPSEAVMPFAGFLAYKGTFDLYAAAIISTIGSIAGSLISYYAGMYFGRGAIVRYGKYMLLGEKELELTERWFGKKWGEKAIFICRFIPVVRHIISIPAGVGRMGLAKFVLYTAAGALIWNSTLLYIGYSLKDSWSVIYSYSRELDIVVAGLLILIVAWFVAKRVKKARAHQAPR